jgi:hypothetical protein
MEEKLQVLQSVKEIYTTHQEKDRQIIKAKSNFLKASQSREFINFTSPRVMGVLDTADG